MLKKNNLDFEISCAIALTLLLLNKLEKSLIFIVTQIYNLAVDNINTNISRTNLSDNIDNLDLSDTTSVNNYNLNTKLKDFIIQNNLIQRIRTIYLYNIILQLIIKTKIDRERRISQALIKKSYCIKLNKCKVIDSILYFRERIFVSNSKRLRIAIIQYLYKAFPTDYSDRTDIYKLVNRHYYWLQIIKTVRKYIKACYLCKRIKVFREVKKSLLKSLSISN